MDNNKPYNEFDERFQDLPVPDAETSWQKMKELLEEDDEKKPLVPVFLKTCAGWGLVFLAAAALTWFVVDPAGWWKDEAPQQQASAKKNPSPSDKPAISNDQTFRKNQEDPQARQSSANSQASTRLEHGSIASMPSESINKEQAIPSEKGTGDASAEKRTGKTASSNSGSVKNSSRKPATTSIPKPGSEALTEISKPKRPGEEKQDQDILIAGQEAANQQGNEKQKNAGGNKGKDLVPAARAEPETETPPADSTEASEDHKSDTVLGNTADSSSAVAAKTHARKKTGFILSAGVGMQQQVPLGNQEAVPYDYYGRKSSIYDYIPSVYVRLEKNKKWFVQGEFRYGAPQSLREFSYSRKTRVDTSSTFVSTTTYRLKKTYYHQLPFSFNYYITPNWSVGAGGIYSRFYGAVTEREVRSKNLQTQAETVSREIVNIKHFNDSFLYKTQVHVLFQTEYHWKRFAFGLRYTKDIQPFIKYTKPDGQVNVEKNYTLQLLVRFRLWQKEITRRAEDISSKN